METEGLICASPGDPRREGIDERGPRHNLPASSSLPAKCKAGASSSIAKARPGQQQWVGGWGFLGPAPWVLEPEEDPHRQEERGQWSRGELAIHCDVMRASVNKQVFMMQVQRWQW